jgi:hypothetical protein
MIKVRGKLSFSDYFLKIKLPFSPLQAIGVWLLLAVVGYYCFYWVVIVPPVEMQVDLGR